MPFRTAETAAEYLKIKDRSDIKDKGGFVGWHVRNGLRRSTTVECRSMLTLDIDSAPEDFLNDFNPRYKAIVYSTHSHTPSKPRYRIIIALSRDISPDEYQAITRYYAADYGIETFDPCSFTPSQLMFWPTVSRDGEYVFKVYGSKPLNPDEFLAGHPD